MSDTKATVTDNPVKAIREALGYSQERLARELKCSVSTLRKCEYEGRLPGTEAVRANLKEIAAKVGIDLQV